MRYSIPHRSHATNAAFLGGGVAFAIAMLPPLHSLAATRFWVHMIQLELLMLVAAPLLVIGNPFAVAADRAPHARPERTHHAMAIVSSVLYALALWIWHVPAFYDAAVASHGLGLAQHASLFLAAVLFWGAVLRRDPAGVDVLCIVVTMIHMGLL